MAKSSGERSAAEKPDDDDVKARIRQAGLKFTGPRAAVLRALAQASAPVSHADVVAAVATDGFEGPTVYRNLIDLEGAGLVHRFDLGDHTWRYELRKDVDDGHAHFVCGSCGAVECLPEASVTLKKAGSRVGRVAEILLKGSCRTCA
jgi:Fur family ferric uptake transcriptional regulator